MECFIATQTTVVNIINHEFQPKRNAFLELRKFREKNETHLFKASGGEWSNITAMEDAKKDRNKVHSRCGWSFLIVERVI